MERKTTIYGKHLGKRVRILREDQRMTQIELARAVGVSNPFISMLESGQRGVDVETLLKLAKVLRVHPYILISDLDIPEDRLVVLNNLLKLIQHGEKTPNYEAICTLIEKDLGAIEK